MINGKSHGNDGFTTKFFFKYLARFRNVHIKGKGSETVNRNQNESVSENKLFCANVKQIGL